MKFVLQGNAACKGRKHQPKEKAAGKTSG